MKPEFQKSFLKQVLPLLIQAGVGILIFLIARAVIIELDMVQAIRIPLRFTLPQLISAVILTIIMIVLVNFGTRMELRLAHIVTEFPQGGYILKLFVFLIVIVIGYGAYLPLVRPYWGEFDWVYHLSFLVLFVVILGVLGHTIYAHTERLSTLIIDLFSGEKRNIPISRTGDIVCGGCGGKNKAGAGFCTSCGAKISPLETVASNCKSCEATLKPDVSFCSSCGFSVGGPNS